MFSEKCAPMIEHERALKEPYLLHQNTQLEEIDARGNIMEFHLLPFSFLNVLSLSENFCS